MITYENIFDKSPLRNFTSFGCLRITTATRIMFVRHLRACRHNTARDYLSLLFSLFPAINIREVYSCFYLMASRLYFTWDIYLRGPDDDARGDDIDGLTCSLFCYFDAMAPALRATLSHATSCLSGHDSARYAYQHMRYVDWRHYYGWWWRRMIEITTTYCFDIFIHSMNFHTAITLRRHMTQIISLRCWW